MPVKYCFVIRNFKFLLHLLASDHFTAFDDRLVEAFPEDVRHEAVDEEVGRGVDHHCKLREVTQQQDPEWQVVAVVLQGSLELLYREYLEKINAIVILSLPLVVFAQQYFEHFLRP